MKITICEYTGNFVCGQSSENIAAVNLDASVCEYRKQVETAIVALGADIEIEWDIRSGEGDPSPYFHAEAVDPDDESGLWNGYEAEIKFSVDAIREKVFSNGTFWTENNA